MSLQPALDAGQLRKNRFRFALAAGNNRHYRIDQITPRHFIETATKSGIPAHTTQDILDELRDTEARAISQALTDLPRGFPEDLASSLTSGLRSRLRSRT